jgi:3-hydroxyisobutyrate dehydrogenase-like beta-hydroxyacid dehydrogenase
MRIGYLGVGNMGQPMAGKLLDGGHELWVCDVREDAMRPLLERQARRAASPKELADACDTIVISLPTLKVFRQAIDGSSPSSGIVRYAVAVREPGWGGSG